MKLLGRAAIFAVILYAALAGLRTANDPDMWWQMSAGRYLATTGHIPRTELFSYTAPGVTWTYPIGSGLLFHWLYKLGGFTLLSLLSPLVTTLIGWLLVRRGGVLRCWAAALAMPAIAMSTMVRANMFSTLLAVGFLAILWDAAAPLWLLPPLMILWVNLHPGFIYGIGIVAAFTLVRPRQLALWAPLTLAATLANPWGWRVYQGIAAQGDVMAVHQTFIREWRRTPLSFAVLRDALNIREVDNAFWWLVALAFAGVFVALFCKQFFGPLLLAATAAGALMFIRFQGLFAITAAMISPALLAGIPVKLKLRAVAAVLLLLFVGERSWHLIDNQQYRQHITMSDFGTGFPRWPPARAAQFIEDHHLPRELYEDYVIGGYATWRFKDYPVFIDGRALPFGTDIFFQQLRLAKAAPEDAEWQAALARWNIRTVLISLDRFFGYGGAPLEPFCQSKLFRLVYLDDTGAVFVRTGDTDLPAIDCRTVQLAPPPGFDKAASNERYHFWANAGFFYQTLRRPADGERALARAQAIFDGDPTIHQTLAWIRVQQDRLDDAESELRRAIAISPTPFNWHSLGDFFARHERPVDALECYRQAMARESEGSKDWYSLGEAALAAGYPKDAVAAADRALAANPYAGADESQGRNLNARALTVKGIALLAMFQVQPAVEALEAAARLAPTDKSIQGPLRAGLADAYYQMGRTDAARQAFLEAQKLGTSDGLYSSLMTRLQWQLGLR